MNRDMVPIKEVNRHRTIDDFNVDIEEANICLFHHAKYAVKRGACIIKRYRCNCWVNLSKMVWLTMFRCTVAEITSFEY